MNNKRKQKAEKKAEAASLLENAEQTENAGQVTVEVEAPKTVYIYSHELFIELNGPVCRPWNCRSYLRFLLWSLHFTC